jgi:type I restriction enzyme R subunit
MQKPEAQAREKLVQHLQSAQLDRVSRVCISTIQRLYSMLRGEEIDAEIDERSGYELRESLWKQPPPVVYNPKVPIETFDFIITDECYRSIYNLWRQVLEYFDAYLIGLTATPSKQTIGFFNKNPVMEYGSATITSTAFQWNARRSAIRQSLCQCPH